MKVRILPTAFDDLYDGRVFYDRQCDGLGDYFFNSVFADIDSLRLCAGIHMKTFGYHRLLAKRFPYAVYYTVKYDHVIIWRVLDLRRDPQLNRRALEDA